MSKSALILVLIYIASDPLDASAMTVEEAYKAIPHARTVFDVNSSKLSSMQSGTLKQLFDYSDRGIVLRMEGLRALQDKNAGGLKAVLSSYRTLTVALSSLSAPEEIKPAQDLVLQSIRLHQNYFEMKLRSAESTGIYDLGFTPDVHQSSQKLRTAYARLIQTFPDESTVNRQAFYDYLCALDFQ